MSVESIISIEINEGSLARLAKLEERLKALSKVNIQVAPSFTGFDKAVREKIRSANYAPLKVQVVPDFTGFRKSIVDQIKGLSLPNINVAVTSSGQQSAPASAPMPSAPPPSTPSGKGRSYSWATRGWGQFIPSALESGGSLAMSALKLPFKALDVGFKIAKKSLDVLWASVKGIMGLIGRVFKTLGIGIAAGAGLAVGGTMFLFKQAMDVSQRAFFTRSLVGTNVGDLPRLQATLGRFADVKTLTSSVAQQQNALYSLPLALMGVSQDQAKSLSTGRLSEMVLRRARSSAKQFGANQITLDMTGLADAGVDLETLQRLLSYSPEKFENVLEYNRRMEEATKIPRQEEYEEFEMKRGVGMARIDAQIKNRLVDLISPMDRFFESLVSAFERKSGGPVNHIIDLFGRGLNRLAQALDTDNWSSLLEDAFKAIKEEGLNAMNWLWDEFKKTFPDTARKMEELKDAIAPMLPTWKQLEELGRMIHNALPSWDQFIKGIKSLPDLFNNLEDAFWMMLETVDRAWQSLAHPYSQYSPSEFAIPREGSRARQRYDLAQEMEAEAKQRRDDEIRGILKPMKLGDISGVALSKNFEPEEAAFLRVLAGLESGGNYQSIVGGGRFTGSGHPRIEGLPGSHAAGAYQFQPGTWDEMRRKMGLREEDFSDPAAQDAVAFALAKDRYKAQTGRDLSADLKAGNIRSVTEALSGTWEALPGSGSKNPRATVEQIQEQIYKESEKIRATRNAGPKGGGLGANPPMDKDVKVSINDNTSANVTIASARMPGAVYG